MAKDKIRLLTVINRLNLGGPTYNVAYLTRYLAPKYESLLVSGMADETEESSEFILESLAIQPRYVRTMQRAISPYQDWKSYQEMRAIIREYRPDIVHTHAAKAGAVGRLAAAAEGVPVILHTFHGHVFDGYFNRLKTNVFIQIERYLARRSSCIVAISPLQKKDLADKYKICPANQIEIIPNGFDLSRFTNQQAELRANFRQTYHLTDDTFAFGIIGRLVPIKNHAFFLEVLQYLNQHLSSTVKWKAFIIGDGESRNAIAAQAQGMGMPFDTVPPYQSSPLIFTSWIKNIEWAMAGLDTVVLTSINEGTPVSLVEAQAAAKPVVSTAVGGVADVVLHNQTGILVPGGAVETFAQAIIRLAQDRNLCNELGQQGRTFSFAHFSYQTLIQNMDTLYEKLLNTR